ncbi:MAG: MazG nucleotide pyrophosphohydrolase domain-containing protein [Planctomycetota bacterium]
MQVRDFQRQIDATFRAKDDARGLPWSYAWLVEEIGELGAALRNLDTVRRTGQPESRKLKDAAAVETNLREEFADVFAWLASLATMAGVDLQDAAQARYGKGCPYCQASPCDCAARRAAAAAADSPAS